AVLTKQGAGSLIIGPAGTNTFGSSVIKAGTLDIAMDASLGTPPAAPMSNNVTLDGGTLRFFSNLAAGQLLNSNRRFFITANGGNSFEINALSKLTIAGAITGSGGFTKGLTDGVNTAATTGTLVLTNSNNGYGGNTIIRQGTLIAAGGGEVIPDHSIVQFALR